MNRRAFLRSAALTVVATYTTGCALIFHGAKSHEERDYDRILWVWLIVDLLFTGPIGVIIDFGSGAIYARKSAKLGHTARPLKLCPEATARVAATGRARKAARYLQLHAPECTVCSTALADVDAPEDVDISSVIAKRGDISYEVVDVQLAV